MRAELFGSVALAAMVAGSPALAADMSRPIAPVPVAYDWTGFYVGANIGGAWVHNSSQEIGPNYWFDNAPAPTYGANAAGVIGGIQAGYNWQFQRVLLGLEADIGLSSADSTTGHTPTFNTALEQTASLKGLATVRGRAGLVFDNVLVYATGGFASGWVQDRVIEPGAANIVFDTSGWRSGWVAGGGFEYAFAKNWTVKAEGLYVDLGSSDAPMPVDNSYRFRFKDTATIGRAGLNFKF